MRHLIFIASFLVIAFANAQDSVAYKKRVLETTELDILTSFYGQDGKNAAVTGGIGTEALNDLATTIKLSIPLNDDDILTIDGTVSAYTSASSSNLNPFDGVTKVAGVNAPFTTAASGRIRTVNNDITQFESTGSPWVASSGESRSDIWGNVSGSYSHSSDDRNKVWSVNASASIEYDYLSFGVGGGKTWLFHEKNTELGLTGNIYFDNWNPMYPTEIHTYLLNNGNLNASFFNGVDIKDQSGAVVSKSSSAIWAPSRDYLIDKTGRNTYSVSLSFSQILTRNAQVSFFADLVAQRGWLANPMQRVYFADKDNFYIGTASHIADYTSPTNTEVFQLADDIERLPGQRLKLPLGVRLNYYLNERLVVRGYYRYYTDDWGLNSNTYSLELPIKISDQFTFRPEYRFYNQTAIDYFASYEQHLSTSSYYTSDYDLSAYTANQYSFGVSYRDIFTKFMGIKTIDLKYSKYDRSTGLKAWIMSMGVKFVIEESKPNRAAYQVYPKYSN